MGKPRGCIIHKSCTMDNNFVGSGDIEIAPPDVVTVRIERP